MSPILMKRNNIFSVSSRLWNRWGWTALTVLAVLTAPLVAGAETPRLPEALKKDTQGKMVLLDFYSDYCGTCQMMEPKLKGIQRKTRDRIAFRHVNVAEDGNRSYWEQFELQGTPTYILYNPQGKPVYKMQGLITPVVLEKQLLRQTGQLKSIEIPAGVELPLLAAEQPDSLNQLLLLSFEDDACQPCREMTPYLNGFEISGKPNLKVIRLNSRAEDGKKLMSQFGIKELPAYALLDNSVVSPENLTNNRRSELFVMTGKVPPRLLWDVIRLFGESGV